MENVPEPLHALKVGLEHETNELIPVAGDATDAKLTNARTTELEMKELEDYLKNNYPLNSAIYRLMCVSFLNDYHRRCRDELVYALHQHDKKMANQVIGCKLIGGAVYDTFDWVRITDKPLWKILITHERRQFFLDYFGGSAIQRGTDKLTDIVHGVEYLINLRSSIKLLSSNNQPDS